MIVLGKELTKLMKNNSNYLRTNRLRWAIIDDSDDIVPLFYKGSWESRWIDYPTINEDYMELVHDKIIINHLTGNHTYKLVVSKILVVASSKKELRNYLKEQKNKL